MIDCQDCFFLSASTYGLCIMYLNDYKLLIFTLLLTCFCIDFHIVIYSCSLLEAVTVMGDYIHYFHPLKTQSLSHHKQTVWESCREFCSEEI